jgi:group I intron endonuclease
MREGYIYFLIDPENNDIKYVGKTINNVKKRFDQHINRCLKKEHNHKCSWVRLLNSKNLKPILKIEEVIRSENIKELNNILYKKEQDWIVKLKSKYKLTNLTDGGIGLVGHKFTEEHKRKISKALSGDKNPMYGKDNPFKGKKHTEETKKIISNKLKGNKCSLGVKRSDITKKRISESRVGKKLSNETKEKLRIKLSEIFKKKLSQNQIEEIKKLKGIKTYRELAKIYGVSKSNIHNIMKKG